MKKLFFGLLILIPIIPVLGQDVVPPENIVDVVTNFETYIGSLLGLGFLSIWVTATINGWLKTPKDWPKRIVSWLVPITIAFVIGYLLKMGFLAEKQWYIVILYGFGAGLFSNGLFTIDFIKAGVQWIEDKLGDKPE